MSASAVCLFVAPLLRALPVVDAVPPCAWGEVWGKAQRAMATDSTSSTPLVMACIQTSFVVTRSQKSAQHLPYMSKMAPVRGQGLRLQFGLGRIGLGTCDWAAIG